MNAPLSMEQARELAVAMVEPDPNERLLAKMRRYRSVFESPDGQWVFADMIRESEFLLSVDTSRLPIDPYLLAIDAGKRSMIAYLVSNLGITEGEVRMLAQKQAAFAIEDAA